MYLFKTNVKQVFIAFILIGSVFALAACGDESGNSDKEPIVLADAGWDSIQFHNAVADIILGAGYGYETEVMTGSTPATLQGLERGDIDVYMELWTDSVMEAYRPMLEAGDVIELGVNFDDNLQGLYVPTFVIEGDAERGIDPMAPDLKYVEDLADYWEVFKDPEDSSKGRIYGSIPGWEADNFLFAMYEGYGLDETFNYFRPGSEAALNTSIVNAMDRGEAWVGYNWEPTWIIGLYDMTFLEERSDDGYLSELQNTDVVIAVNESLPERAPEVVEFLENYQTDSALVNEVLAYMESNNADASETAEWFLKEYEDVWTQWVPEDVAESVRSSVE